MNVILIGIIFLSVICLRKSFQSYVGHLTAKPLHLYLSSYSCSLVSSYVLLPCVLLCNSFPNLLFQSRSQSPCWAFAFYAHVPNLLILCSFLKYICYHFILLCVNFSTKVLPLNSIFATFFILSILVTSLIFLKVPSLLPLVY
jgi:hypothetical protein